MSILLKLNKKYHLRGSVSFIPYKDGKTVEFFKSNIRISKKLYLEQNLINFIKFLNGKSTVNELVAKLNLDEKKVLSLIDFMLIHCLIQDDLTALMIEKHQFNHVLNFLADYIPYEKLEIEFKKLQNSHVVIIGLGAVGSWVSIQLAKTGIENFTLIDSDIVEKSNLNRTFFDDDDIGIKKIIAMEEHLKSINKEIKCSIEDRFLTSSDNLDSIINKIVPNDVLVINCADVPNVDTTSSWVNDSCIKFNIPYIIAGGYNLHLTLLGPTIIPFETSCYSCIDYQLNHDDVIDDLMKSKKLVRPNRNIGNIVPMATITSTFVVNESIRTILKSTYLEPIMTNRRGNINFFNNKINFFNFHRDPTCEKCSTLDNSFIEDTDKFINEFYKQIKISKITNKKLCELNKDTLLSLLSLMNSHLVNFNKTKLNDINIDESCRDTLKYIFGVVYKNM